MAHAVDITAPVRVYTKKRCQPCLAVKRRLREKKVDFTEVNVDELTEDELTEALEHLAADDHKASPVVYFLDADGVVESFSGFNPYKTDEIVKLYGASS